MRVLLLSTYHTGSHRQWAEGYRDHSGHEVHLLTHEGSFWTWRLTGGFVTMAEEVRAAVVRSGPPDVLLATGMLDLAGLLGLLRRELGEVPAAVYMHENQVTYPALGRVKVEALYGLMNWASLLAADGVAFNSAFHREAFFEALPVLLGSFPDRRHEHLIPAVAARTVVLPVGIDLSRLDPPAPRSGPLRLLWNHRWDPDKDPAAFLAAAGALAGEDREFRVLLAGERFVGQASQHADAVRRLGDRVEVDRYLDDDAYGDVLRRADLVVSTAHQEFFGVSVVEAMYAGAMPVLPDRLVYPERVPDDLRERCLYRGLHQLVDRLRWAADHRGEARVIGARLRPTVAGFDWRVVAPAVDDWLAGLG